MWLLVGIAPGVSQLATIAATGTNSATGTTATSSTTTTTTVKSTKPNSSAGAGASIRRVSVFGIGWNNPNPEALELLLVVAMAMIGANVHVLTSLSTFIGNRRFVESWSWWYVIRPPVGVGIAIVLYFVLRAGFVSVTSNGGNINPYGVAAFAGLAGMFSKQATDKLREIFDTAFKTSGDAQRADKVQGGLTIDHVTPASLPVATNDLEVRVFGRGFFAATAASVGGHARHVTVRDPTELTVTLVAEDVARPGVVPLRLAPPAPATAPPGEISVRVRPAVHSIQAANATDREPRVAGLGFRRNTQVFVGPDSRRVIARNPPRDAHPTELVVRLTDADFDDRAERQVTVRNRDSEGGESDPFPLAEVDGW